MSHRLPKIIVIAIARTAEVLLDHTYGKNKHDANIELTICKIVVIIISSEIAYAAASASTIANVYIYLVLSKGKICFYINIISMSLSSLKYIFLCDYFEC